MKPNRLFATHGMVVAFSLAVSLVGLTGCSRSKPATTTPPSTPASPAMTKAADTRSEPVAVSAPTDEAQLATGKQLYANYCAACHGDTGDGNGPAARFVYPKPRNFRDARFRLVTTVNRVPSDDDLMHVIDRGMPGSAMFPFAHLSDSDRRALVVYVRHLTRTGVEDRLRQVAAEFGDTLDPAELLKDVDQMTNPGPTIEIPAHWPTADGKSVDRGRELYMKQCATCHGNTGKGDGVQDQRDDDGMPTSPRDYTRGIFKGGREREQLYARTLLGMPGTPMPSSSHFTPDQIGDLVNYLQSLSDPSAQNRVQHKRTRVVAKRAGEPLPDEMPDAAWQSAPASSIVVNPLWWRNYAEPDLQVQALHDGRTIAIRLTWQDETRNQQAVRPQEFADMVAVQLFRGTREPFLGMGATDGSVDMWLWQAGGQAAPGSRADVDTAYPNMAVDMYPFEQQGDGPRPHATQNQLRDFITAWAAGNLRSDPTSGLPANALRANGFGTLTMMPKLSQLVSGTGTWSDGRWTVVLHRPLEVSADSGIQPAPGDKLSFAIAVWDGTARDRNGQKLVSIWHDLELER